MRVSEFCGQNVLLSKESATNPHALGLANLFCEAGAVHWAAGEHPLLRLCDDCLAPSQGDELINVGGMGSLAFVAFYLH